MGSELADEKLEDGRRLFARACVFVAGAASPEGLPQSPLPEIAFAGRSNVGKSSLLNALTGRNRLARVSSTPGRTRQINFFELDGRLMLADLPGYGFARASKTEAAAWNALTLAYLRNRTNLRRAILLVDSRRGLMKPDLEVMVLLDQAAVSFQIVLTKIDELKPDQLPAIRASIVETAARHPAAHPWVAATSANTLEGVPDLRAALGAFATPPPAA